MEKWEDYNENPSDYSDEEESLDGTDSGYDEELDYYESDDMIRSDQEEVLGAHSYYANAEELDRLDEEDEEYENRDYRPIRRRRDGKRGCLGGLMYAVFVISLSIILACMAWMAASDVLALNKAEHSAVVTIDKDFELDDIVSQLKDNGLIEYKSLFKLFTKVSKAEDKINPGTYELNTKFDYRALVSKMQVGSEAQQVTTVTFPEGFSVKQIFQRLEENNICSVEDLEEASANYNYSYSFLENIPMGEATRLEGYLFPDTYDFYEGEQASNAINRFLKIFHYSITAEMYERAEEMGYTFHQILTIASMIEKEAADDDERSRIAGVIYNRLTAGDLLGIDATVHYLLDEPKTSLNAEDLAIDSPYNTRKYPGLPPGPICNPGIASINAALYPDNTNEYFYALDTETGKHRFFTNETEFNNFTATQNYD